MFMTVMMMIFENLFRLLELIHLHVFAMNVKQASCDQTLQYADLKNVSIEC